MNNEDYLSYTHMDSVCLCIHYDSFDPIDLDLEWVLLSYNMYSSYEYHNR
jgi:hypothetical protein